MLPISSFQRSLILIGVALALPAVVLVVLSLLFALDREREAIERETQAKAEQVVALVDARIDADLAVMNVLATTPTLAAGNWRGFATRAAEIARMNKDWRNVILSDLDRGVEVFNLNNRLSGPSAPIRQAISAAASAPEAKPIGGIEREGEDCPCVYLHAPAPGASRLLLTVIVDPAAYQRLLSGRIPEQSIAALVDAEGDFIARSVDYRQRVGTPATEFVRKAVAGPEKQGLYAGVTYEGFRNYSAFAKSDRSGWSMHIAIASSLINGPRTASLYALGFGLLVALALAGALVAYALNDLAQRRSAEARLAQAQKLEALGLLTGGVAHDFNNLLTVIIGGLGMLQRRTEDPRSAWIAENMLEAARRGERLTKQLLAFSRGKQMELGSVDVVAVVNGLEELLHRSVQVGVSVERHLPEGPLYVWTDANQFELAILNLVINASDAMPRGGRVIITAAPLPKDPDMVLVSVTDTGVGMTKEVADRALEPFFTTKDVGKGTGLGLAQVYGAMRQSGGSLELDSAPGKGTTIRLLLKAAEAPQAAAVTEPQAPPIAAAGQRVLVVDDEPAVRAFVAQTLRDAGYEAATARDGPDALGKLEGFAPHVVVTDFSMPGMNGLALAEAARRERPDLKILIMSGFADADLLEASAAAPALLRKPFDDASLIEAVATLCRK